MAYEPTDIANRALDAIAAGSTIGDIEDGSEVAQIALRHYAVTRMQLLRTAHWAFARRQLPMVLLADATGNTPNVGTKVADQQFIYEYEWPIDCVKIIYIPWFWQNYSPGIVPGNLLQQPYFPNPQPASPFNDDFNSDFGGQSSPNVPINPNTPMMTGNYGQTPFAGQRPRPAPFIVTSDPNYPPAPGQQTWEVLGVSPIGRTVICTNVKNACLVYIYDALYPSTWDALFRAAMVAYLASEIALPVWAKRDRKFGLEVRGQQIQIAKNKIIEARIADGNDGVFSSDIPVNWMQARRNGYNFGWNGLGGPGNAGGAGFGCSYDSCQFSDGTSY